MSATLHLSPFTCMRTPHTHTHACMNVAKNNFWPLKNMTILYADRNTASKMIIKLKWKLNITVKPSWRTDVLDCISFSCVYTMTALAALLHQCDELSLSLRC